MRSTVRLSVSLCVYCFCAFLSVSRRVGQIAAGLASTVILVSKSRGTQDHVILCHDSGSHTAASVSASVCPRNIFSFLCRVVAKKSRRLIFRRTFCLACYTNRGKEKLIWGFGKKYKRKETARKT
jgi:hypothetical protein